MRWRLPMDGCDPPFYPVATDSSFDDDLRTAQGVGLWTFVSLMLWMVAMVLLCKYLWRVIR